MLLGSAKEVQAAVGHYLQRWRSEDCFRMLKSGCGVERPAFRTALRLRRDIAIKSVIECRPMVLTLLGRQVSDLEAGLPFSASALAFL